MVCFLSKLPMWCIFLLLLRYYMHCCWPSNRLIFYLHIITQVHLKIPMPNWTYFNILFIIRMWMIISCLYRVQFIKFFLCELLKKVVFYAFSNRLSLLFFNSMDLWQEINYETMLWVKTCRGDGASCNEKGASWYAKVYPNVSTNDFWLSSCLMDIW